MCWPQFFKSFQREDFRRWNFLPVQSLTSGWMEQNLVYQTTRPSVKVDPQRPQHHLHHHPPNHHLTQRVRPDSALHTRYHQDLTVSKMEEGKMWFLAAWQIYQEKTTSGILAQAPVTVVRQQWTYLIMLHSHTTVIIQNLILIINLQSKGATTRILVGGSQILGILELKLFSEYWISERAL